jgi:CBS domain-containing protein
VKIDKLIVKSVLTCYPEDNLCAPARAMWEGDCGSIPVVDSWSRVIGMITDRDICMAAYTQGRPLHEIRVQDVMSKTVVSCTTTDSLEQAEELMRRNKVRRLPVLDADRKLVGLLSLNDIARGALAEPLASRDARMQDAGQLLAEVGEPRLKSPACCALEPVTRKLSVEALEIC